VIGRIATCLKGGRFDVTQDLPIWQFPSYVEASALEGPPLSPLIPALPFDPLSLAGRGNVTGAADFLSSGESESPGYSSYYSVII
jgi:hypothetical protein